MSYLLELLDQTDIDHLVASLDSPPNAATVRMAESTSLAIRPASA